MIPLRDRNPSGTFPAVTIAVIVACTAAFLYELSLGQGLNRFLMEFALVPGQVSYGIQTGEHWRGIVPPFFTSMFLHGGWLHLIGNMWFLWIFGDNVEDALGSFRFVFFYLACGLAAGFTHFILGPSSAVPTIGASGAIAGVLGGYLVLYPGARVLTLVPLGFFMRIMELPAALMIGLWFLIQLASGLLTQGMEGGGVAWWAHVGGFIAGLALVKLLRKRRLVV
jgi:membrane associated rhomboid family serine protease